MAGVRLVLTNGSRFKICVCAILRRDLTWGKSLCRKWYSLPSLPGNWVEKKIKEIRKMVIKILCKVLVHLNLKASLKPK